MKPTPNQEITDRILETLEEVPVQNIEQIAKNAKTTKITATKHLNRLTQKGRIQEFTCGRNRVFIFKENVLV